MTFFFLLIYHHLYELIGNTPWNWSQRYEKGFLRCEMRPNVDGNCIVTLGP